MGTMSEELVASMLRSFRLVELERQTARQEELAGRADKPPVWRWAQGTFVFPEGLCCYCGGVMRSPCIFQAVNRQYYGSWKVVRGEDGVGRLVYDDSHPHVNNGSICMGAGNYQAGSVADALFLAFNPLSSYFGEMIDPVTDQSINTNTRIKRWFADRFDHSCESKLDVTAIAGVNQDHVIAAVEGCHCPHCRLHRNEVQCQIATCRAWIDPGQSHGQFTCRRCMGRRYCIRHEHDFHQCMDCGGNFDLWCRDTGTRHEVPPISQCAECEAWVCDWCMSMEAGSERHACVRTAEDKADEDDDYCDHSCCLDCCARHGCDLVEAGWEP